MSTWDQINNHMLEAVLVVYSVCIAISKKEFLQIYLMDFII